VITLQCSLTAMIEGPPSSDASVAAFGATSRRSLEIELPNLPGAHAGVRLKAMEQRLAAMFQAVQTVEPVLEILRLAQRRAEETLQSVAAAPSMIPAGPTRLAIFRRAHLQIYE
jgi:hypothetical protein